jgi:hypothetical protein
VRVRFRLEAAADVESSRARYDEQRKGLGDEFVEALERAIELVSTFPDAFPEIAPRSSTGAASSVSLFALLSR